MLFAALVVPAWGAGINFFATGAPPSGKVYNESGIAPGNELTVGRALQFISGGYVPPTSTGALGSGNSLLGVLGTVGEGAGSVAGCFARVDENPTGAVYVRAWNGTAPDRGVRYGYSALGAASGGTSPPNPFPVPNFWTNIIATEPGAPTLLAVSVSELHYDGATLRWQHPAGFEITRYKVFYGTRTGGGGDVDETSGGVIEADISDSVNSPLRPVGSIPPAAGARASNGSFSFPRAPQPGALSPGTTYYVQVAVSSPFGFGPRSNVISFTTLSPAARSAHKFSFRKPANKHGINSFSIPYWPMTITPEAAWGAAGRYSVNGGSSWFTAVISGTITNALELINAINQIPSLGVVKTFGEWQNNLQMVSGEVVTYASGINIDPGVAARLGAFPLTVGKGYQIYLTTGDIRNDLVVELNVK